MHVVSQSAYWKVPNVSQLIHQHCSSLLLCLNNVTCLTSTLCYNSRLRT